MVGNLLISKFIAWKNAIDYSKYASQTQRGFI
jgi:hypothetical protein